ncbi:hypothetical protein MMC22_003915 [Lobaria immixta]|nr:hypothetical protein [Lobaria immixta]
MVTARRSTRLAQSSRHAVRPVAAVTSNLSSTLQTQSATSGELSAPRAREREHAIRKATSEAEIARLKEELERLRTERLRIERKKREMNLAERDHVAIRTEMEAKDQSVPFQSEDVDILLDPRFQSLVADYPLVEPIYFRQIAGNKFDPMDISNLENEIYMDEGWKSNGIRDLAHLIRCLGVYWQAKLHFAPQSRREGLSRAFHLYQDQLLSLYPVFTWDSLRDYHLRFHLSIRYQTDNLDLWRKPAGSAIYGRLVHQSRPRNRGRANRNQRRNQRIRYNNSLPTY